jgi:hypothetical protein
MSIALALLSGLLSGIGWLAGLIMTRHPFLEELTRIAGLVIPRLLVGKSGLGE